jgi:hypothetical protein
MSMLAGWQRGGWLSERVVWVAIGVVLVVSSHVLPALSRSAPFAVRCGAVALWAACMAATCYGHATFFLLSQQHAGERRAEAVMPLSVAPAASTGQNLAALAAERASVVTDLAAAKSRRCSSDCTAARLKRASLAARLDALNIEVDEARRQEMTDDRYAAQADRVSALRDAARADPTTTRLAGLLGIAPARVDLLSGMGFAGVLECVACLFWLVALQPCDSVITDAATLHQAVPVTTSHEAVTSSQAIPVTASHDSTAFGHGPVGEVDAPQLGQSESELDRLIEEIAAGRLRATVADIRRHLGCSQSRASSLRRELLQHDPPDQAVLPHPNPRSST